MIRDRFLRQIVDALGREVDDQAFERCAAELVRMDFPGTVWVPGGGDSGQDGAVADAKGEAYPLITTVGKEVLRNVKRNIKKYLGDGGMRRTVIVATTQALTPKRRANIEQAGRESGVEIVQVYDREAIAARLYRRPKVAHDLLGLTGETPALSSLPSSERPRVTDELVGREGDYSWVRAQQYDALVVGQPGSGKTSLLENLARSSDGLFVVEYDLTRISNELREEAPKVLIVDDAQLRVDFLVALRRLRDDLGARFTILAASWPGARHEISTAMSLSQAQIRELESLTRDEMVKVVNATSIHGPRALVRELVTQADGRPGLAITLCFLCLRGDWRFVASGEALYRDVLRALKRVGAVDEAVDALAALALSGSAGMSVDGLARILQMPPLRTHSLLSALSASGTVHEANDGTLSVRPRPLRYAIVRDYFFTPPARISLNGIVAEAAQERSVVETLLHVRGRGGAVPDSLVRPWLEQLDSQELWRLYSSLGRDETTWVLERQPSLVQSLGAVFLYQAPDLTIPKLLSAAVGDERQLGPNPGHPLRQLRDWVREGEPGTQEGLVRRRQLLEASQAWALVNSDRDVLLQALALVISPEFEDTHSDAGSGRTLTFRQGILTIEEMQDLSDMWPGIAELLTQKPATSWTPLLEATRSWLYPRMMATPLPEKLADLMRGVAERILRDLAVFARTRPALSREIRELVLRRDLTIELMAHEPFDSFYPVHVLHADFQKEQEEYLIKGRRAAAVLLAEGREQAIEKLLSCEREAATLTRPWPRLTPDACAWIAAQVPDPLVWGEQLAARAAPGDLVFPFLDEARKKGDTAWLQAASRLLSQASTRGAAIRAILTANEASDEAVRAAIRVGSEWDTLIRGLAAGGLLSDVAIAACITAEDAHLASSVAGALFHSRPSISSNPQWRAAILRASPEADEIVQALRADSSLALEWLVAVVGRSDENTHWYHEHVIEEAISALSKEERIELVRAIPEAWFMRDMVSGIVGTDPEIFRVLLDQTHLSESIRLAPLNGSPNRPQWVSLALAALDHGFSVEEVHDACHGNGWSWHGSESLMWQGWVDGFSSLAKHPDTRLQLVARIGTERAARQRDAARVRERAEAVQGF